VAKLKKGWEDAKDGLRFAINYLRTNADIEDESLLSSPMFFIAVAYFSHKRKQKLSRADERGMLYWLYVANAKGRYSRGSSETILDEDLTILRKDGGPDELLVALRKQFGRLEIEPADFAGRGAGSALFSLVFLALKAKGATDWRTGLGLSLTHQGRYHYIQYHHIFPRAVLKDKYEKQEINEIANMAFVSGRMNQELGKTEPGKYLPRVIAERGEEALTLQVVPLDSHLHQVANFRAFLETRRAALATAVSEFLDKAKGK
jgi:hypothetical protein